MIDLISDLQCVDCQEFRPKVEKFRFRKKLTLSNNSAELFDRAKLIKILRNFVVFCIFEVVNFIFTC
jgi:hypothetical protein